MSRTWNIIVTTWLVIGLTAPAAALLIGVRNSNIEQRTLSQRPSLAPSRLLDQTTLSALDRYLTDRFPLRDRSAEARALLSYRLFRTSTNPGVRVGRDGWLYLSDELQTCDGTYTVAQEATAYGSLIAALRSLAPSAFLLVAPDKVVIDGSHLARLGARDRCALRRDTDARRAFSTLDGAIDLWSTLTDRSGSEQLYYKVDSHWSPAGRSLMAETLVSALGGTWESTHVASTPAAPAEGDLGRLLGLRLREALPGVSVRRPGVTTTEVTAGQPHPRTALRQFVSRGTAPLLPPIILIGDSQFEHALGDLAPWFSRLTLCQWEAVLAGSCDDALARPATVVVESVERSLGGRVRFGQLAALLRAASAPRMARSGVPATAGPDGLVRVTVPAASDAGVLLATSTAPIAFAGASDPSAAVPLSSTARGTSAAVAVAAARRAPVTIALKTRPRARIRLLALGGVTLEPPRGGG